MTIVDINTKNPIPGRKIWDTGDAAFQGASIDESLVARASFGIAIATDDAADVFDIEVRVDAGAPFSKRVIGLTGSLGHTFAEDDQAKRWNFLRIVRTSGTGNVTAFDGAAGGLASGPMIANVPPLLANLIHRYRFADTSTLFSDLAGTVLAVPAGQVRNVKDLGLRGNDILGVAGAGNPIFTAGAIGGKAALDFPTEDTGELDVIDAIGLTVGTGVTIAGVWRRIVTVGTPTTFPAHVLQWGNNGDAGEIRMSYDGTGNGRPQFESDNITIIGPNPNLVDSQWEWFYHTDGAPLATARSNHSGPSTEISSANPTFNAVPAGRTIRIGLAIVQIAELLVYDVDMSVAQLTALTDYFDAEYGTLPF